MWTIQQFVKLLEPQVPRYKQDNSWVSWWSKDPTEDIYNSWRMYKTASTAALGFLLLGDTKIRKDQTLLMNFGTATAHDIQEEEERKLVMQLSDRRKVMSYGTDGVRYAPAKGTGSILSDNKWTPMLNDCFMLGGIHKRVEFHLAEDFFHSKTARLTGKSATEKWLYFFQRNELSFWGSFGPRVFARECIGLKTAGYKPHFANHGLVFSGGSGMGLDFAKYLQAVTNAGLTGRNKMLAIQNISEFLFKDRNALKY